MKDASGRGTGFRKTVAQHPVLDMRTRQCDRGVGTPGWRSPALAQLLSSAQSSFDISVWYASIRIALEETSVHGGKRRVIDDRCTAQTEKYNLVQEAVPC